jgi:predicted 3-demethylubiquinone-9 3-methyltransferase (glyoxalase superfamily)
MSKVSTCLWFDGTAEEAARFYVSLLPDSHIDRVQRSPVDWPGGKAGEAVMIVFTLAGRSYQALNGGPNYRLSPACSLSVTCEDQAEVDRLWAALTDGGREVQCGWLEDRYGLSWQIVPQALVEMMASDDAAAAGRAFVAMLGMVKLDIAALQRAYRGD